ncbi:sulfate ABC transporter permease subunit CysT [Advenella sp. RU8]|jgi:sulfate transport system permease protein|uniref:sulfate ABC transporter permease subunit CysT n=1 Tax=unclassified Advenella TaxID=2685285 RepID=UPI00145F3A1C|nr:sulfate ABC transporter permease subunit CysT [Advenella sp. EE-W14]NLN68973.1 sulfate ABC transporter permease subunit CysT [Alcaligenaceae bacterium]
MNILQKQYSVLPGFGLTFGISLLWLCLIVLIPFAVLFGQAGQLGLGNFLEVVGSERVLHALKITFGTSLAAVLVNLVFGLITAWVLVRYTFPGKKIVDAFIDLPFALPTAVAGIALTTLYAPNGLIGQVLQKLDIKVAFTPAGITVALIFISLPFIVRTVQPVLEDLEVELEDAATCLGASRWQIFSKVIFPAITPALLTGAAMAFARAAGEYGSVIFIAGNIPMVSEIAPLLITAKLEQFDYNGATAIAVTMLLISFLVLLLINLIQRWSNRRYGMN